MMIFLFSHVLERGREKRDLVMSLVRTGDEKQKEIGSGGGGGRNGGDGEC